MFGKKIVCSTFIAGVAVLLSSCSADLGDHEFQNAELVDIKFLERIDPEFRHGLPMKKLVRIIFTSTTDLEAASEGGSLYVDADFCPFQDENGIGVIGPYYDDKSRYGPILEKPFKGEDGRAATLRVSENRSPVLNENTGEFTYTAYIIPYRNPSRHKQSGNIILKPYDIRTDDRDICFRLASSGGMFSKPGKSNIFQINRSKIAEFLED